MKKFLIILILGLITLTGVSQIETNFGFKPLSNEPFNVWDTTASKINLDSRIYGLWEGQTTYVQDIDSIFIYDGTVWKNMEKYIDGGFPSVRFAETFQDSLYGDILNIDLSVNQLFFDIDTDFVESPYNHMGASLNSEKIGIVYYNSFAGPTVAKYYDGVKFNDIPEMPGFVGHTVGDAVACIVNESGKGIIYFLDNKPEIYKTTDYFQSEPIATTINQSAAGAVAGYQINSADIYDNGNAFLMIGCPAFGGTPYYLYSNDDLLTWNEPSGLPATINFVDVREDGIGYAISPTNILYYSEDYGATWTIHHGTLTLSKAGYVPTGIDSWKNKLVISYEGDSAMIEVRDTALNLLYTKKTTYPDSYNTGDLSGLMDINKKIGINKNIIVFGNDYVEEIVYSLNGGETWELFTDLVTEKPINYNVNVGDAISNISVSETGFTISGQSGVYLMNISAVHEYQIFNGEEYKEFVNSKYSALDGLPDIPAIVRANSNTLWITSDTETNPEKKYDLTITESHGEITIFDDDDFGSYFMTWGLSKDESLIVVATNTNPSEWHYTTDNGETWTKQPASSSASLSFYSDLSVTNDGHCVVAGWEGDVYYSTDTARTWTQATFNTTQPSGHVTAMRIIESGFGMCADQNKNVWKTRDYGATWDDAPSIGTRIHFFEFNEDGYGLAGGTNGDPKTRYTKDWGETWQQAGYPWGNSYGSYLGDDGFIWIGTSNSDTWTQAYSNVIYHDTSFTNPITRPWDNYNTEGIDFNTNGLGFRYSSDNLYEDYYDYSQISYNFGQSWHNFPLRDLDEGFWSSSKVRVLENGTIWLGEYGGKLYKIIPENKQSRIKLRYYDDNGISNSIENIRETSVKLDSTNSVYFDFTSADYLVNSTTIKYDTNFYVNVNASGNAQGYKLRLDFAKQDTIFFNHTLITGQDTIGYLVADTGINVISVAAVQDLKFGVSTWILEEVSNVGGAGSPGISDAPADGNQYARQNNSWTPITEPETITYLSGDLTDGIPTISEINTILSTTPSSVGAGYVAYIYDNSGIGAIYMVLSNGSNWFVQPINMITE